MTNKTTSQDIKSKQPTPQWLGKIACIVLVVAALLDLPIVVFDILVWLSGFGIQSIALMGVAGPLVFSEAQHLGGLIYLFLMPLAGAVAASILAVASGKKSARYVYTALAILFLVNTILVIFYR